MSRRSLLVVFAVALAARLFTLFELADEALFAVLLGDAVRFDEWAREIAAGEVYGEEVFYQAPLYAYFLGTIYAILGSEPFAARIVQALLGAAGCALVGAATARLFAQRVGWAAGLLCALYAPAIWLDGLIQKTSLALFLSALLLYLMSRCLDSNRLRWAGAAGIVLGLLVLVRENAFILIFPFGALFAFSPKRGQQKTTGVFLLATIMVLFPVGTRNALLGGTFLPTSSNAGINFYLGNNIRADGLYMPLVEGRGHASYESADAERLAERETGEELSPAQVSLHWFRRGLEDVGADHSRWILLMVRKAFLLVHRSEAMDTESFESYGDRSGLLGFLGPVTNFGLLFPLALIGLWFTWESQRRLWPFTLAAVALGGSILLFFVVARFRIGLLPFLAPFAAAGIVGLLDHLRARSPLSSFVGPLLLGVGGVGLSSWSLFVPGNPLMPGDPRATTDSNLASAFLRQGDLVRAAEFGEEAVRREPENAQAHFNLGLARKGLGELNGAEESFSTAIQLLPDFGADGVAELGAVKALQGDTQGALALFRRALRADPENPRAHHYLGLTLRREGMLEEAAREYEAAIRSDPGFVYAHHDLGYVRQLQGRWVPAIRHYRAALEIDPRFLSSLESLAWILAAHPEERLRNGEEALALAERAVAIDPDRLELWVVLAAAYAEVGRFEDAKREIDRALDEVDDPALREVLQERRALYTAGEAYRIPL